MKNIAIPNYDRCKLLKFTKKIEEPHARAQRLVYIILLNFLIDDVAKHAILMWEPKMCRFAWQLLGMLGNVLGRLRHALQCPKHALQIYIYIYILYC